MMWFDFIKWLFHLIRGRFHYSECIQCSKKYMIQNRISFEIQMWNVWKIEHNNLGINTDGFPRRSGRSKHFAYLNTYMLFCWKPVVSWFLYNRANQWLLEPGFAFKLHILHKSYNFLHKQIAYRRCNKPNNVQCMKCWEDYATWLDVGFTMLLGEFKFDRIWEIWSSFASRISNYISMGIGKIIAWHRSVCLDIVPE